MNNDAPEIKSEIEDAKQDLREALNEVEERVGEGIARVEDGIASLNPERSIKRRPIAAACIAAALGATLGSKSHQASIFGLALFGAAAIALFMKEEDAAES
jgi:ElaB/YqjD/DUF883 family membrane-anchored ribosome-binding protein